MTLSHVCSTLTGAAAACLLLMMRNPTHFLNDASEVITLQIMSSDLLCCAVEDQSLVLFVMDILLSNVTNLVTLRIVNTTSYDNGSSLLDEYPYAANFTLTASTSTYAPVPSLQVVNFLLVFCYI